MEGEGCWMVCERSKQNIHHCLCGVLIQNWTLLLPQQTDCSPSFVYFNEWKSFLHSQASTEGERSEELRSKILTKADGNDQHIMQEAYCMLHDETEGRFYTDLNCRVWHLVSEKNILFKHSSPCCFVEAVLCKEVVCNSMLKRRYCFPKLSHDAISEFSSQHS